MSLIIPSRRGFIAGMASLIAAPAVVRASSLMKIVAVPELVLPLRPDDVFKFRLEISERDDFMWYRVDIATGAVTDQSGKAVLPHPIMRQGQTLWLRTSPAEGAA